jgi:hypothetical protein
MQFSWIYWANPMAYAFKAVFSNEMKGLVFPCTGNGAIPFGPTYNDTSVLEIRFIIVIFIYFVICRLKHARLLGTRLEHLWKCVVRTTCSPTTTTIPPK